MSEEALKAIRIGTLRAVMDCLADTAECRVGDKQVPCGNSCLCYIQAKKLTQDFKVTHRQGCANHYTGEEIQKIIDKHETTRLIDLAEELGRSASSLRAKISWMIYEGRISRKRPGRKRKVVAE